MLLSVDLYCMDIFGIFVKLQ